MDRGAWWAAVNGVTRDWTRLSAYTHMNKAWEHDLSNETLTAALVVTEFSPRSTVFHIYVLAWVHVALSAPFHLLWTIFGENVYLHQITMMYILNTLQLYLSIIPEILWQIL